LTVETIRRTMVEHPDQAPHDVLAAYLSCLRSETVAGSCIFHQRDGCGLPREMRSETCNRYFCRGLTEFQTGLAVRGHARAFFAATEGESILAAAFCNAEGSQLVPLSQLTDNDQPDSSASTGRPDDLVESGGDATH
jgi:hypothetical protein